MASDHTSGTGGLFAPIRRRLAITVSCGALLAAGRPAAALDRGKALTQFVHDVWTADRGLPQSAVHAIARTADGYLWIGTDESLARFDGQRFELHDGSASGLVGFAAATLLADGSRVWIGTPRHGVCRFENGHLIASPERSPAGWITALAGDADGSLWTATSPYGGLSHLVKGSATTYTMRDGLSSDSVQTLARDRKGRLWIGTTSGLDLLENGRLVSYTAADGLAPGAVFAILEDREGTLWIGTKEGDPGSPGDRGALTSLRGGRFTRYDTGAGGDSPGIRTLAQDRDGSLWAGTFGGGLRRFANGAFAEPPLLAGATILALFEDPEGSLWIGSDTDGLHRLRDAPFTTFAREEGLPDDVVESLHEDGAGAVWIGTRWGGAARLSSGRFTTFSTREGLPSDTVNAIAEQPRGVLWLGTAAGLVRLVGGRPEIVSPHAGPSAENVNALLADRDGSLWIGTWEGLFHFVKGTFTRLTRKDGLPGDLVNDLLRTRDGTLWIATSGGVARVTEGGLASVIASGWSAADAVALHEDAEGALWVGTRGDGLHLFRDGRLSRFTRKHGLPDDVVATIGEDGKGNLWLSGGKGIARIPRAALLELAAGRRASVEAVVYGTADGLRSRECSSGQGQLRARDGRLWFATVRGASVIDPAANAANAVEPPVVIQTASAGGVSFDPASEPRVPGGRATLEVRYAGLSYLVPERVRYRYRLEGLNDEWIDAGTRREAFFANIPPGRYTFRVTAANDGGVFSPNGAALSLVVLPRFWQTWWFRLLGAGAVAGLAVLAPRRRGSQLEREKAEQERLSRRFNELQENERKRIAAELHDSLGQSLVIIKNRARLATESTGDAGAVREQLEEITESATAALAEVRQIAYDLRPFHIDRLGLTKAVEALVKNVGSSTGLDVRSSLADVDGVLPAADEISFYRIVQEALGNAVKHSGAKAIEVTIRRENGAVGLTIRDDGRGFDLAQAAPAAGPGGFGLVGMAERAKILRAGLTIRSAPGQGTTIALDVRRDRHAD